MSNKTDITFEQVQSFILKKVSERAKLLGLEVDGANIGGEESMLDSGFFDSLSFLDLLGEIENEYDVEIDLSEHEPAYFMTANGFASITIGSVADSFEENEGAEKTENSELQYEDITPEHPQWNDVAKLFHAMYSYFLDKNLKIPLAKNGEEIWLKSLKNNIGRTNRIFGCLDGEILIGYVHGTIKILPAFLEGNTVGFINGIYINTEYRKKGIADELYKMVEEWFQTRNVDSVELQVLDDNEAAIAFWHKTGFEYELLQMRKILQGA